MVQVFCRIGKKTQACDISSETYTKLRERAQKIGCSLPELVKKAWQKHGISEKAIKKYLKKN